MGREQGYFRERGDFRVAGWRWLRVASYIERRQENGGGGVKE
jgi:hypothetical protein